VGVGGQAGGGEVALGEFGEAFAVEGCFEVFEGEGVVEDFDYKGFVSVSFLRRFAVLKAWCDLLSEKSFRLCLLLRLRGRGRAHVEATRPRTAAYFASDMLTIACYSTSRL
jgi:hypothetical protein